LRAEAADGKDCLTDEVAGRLGDDREKKVGPRLLLLVRDAPIDLGLDRCKRGRLDRDVAPIAPAS
jgi:hypothetical protein